MQSTKIFRYAILFAASIIISLTLVACGEDGPSAPEGGSDFNFSGDLIAFRRFFREILPDIFLLPP